MGEYNIMRKYLLAVLIISMFSFGSADVKSSCGPGEKSVLELANSDDSHVFETGSGKNYNLCISNEFDHAVEDRGSGPSSYTLALDVSSFYSDTNIGGHVGLPGEYSKAKKQLYLEHSTKNIADVTSSCSGDCQFLLSVYSSANSHAGAKDQFSNNLYVKLSSPSDPNINIDLGHGSSGGDTRVNAQLSASASSGSISSCELDWGDGATEPISNFNGDKTHDYASSGSYTATYSCTDTGGNTASSADSIEVPLGGGGGGGDDLTCSGGNVINSTSGETQEQCGPTESWDSCSTAYENTCDEEATQSRVVRGCSSGSCYSSTEQRTCQRDTDGDDCPPGSGKECRTESCVDITAPDTSDNSDNNWHDTQQNINLNCDDSVSSGNGGSGCSQTYYCVDQSNNCNPTDPGSSVNINDEGVNYLRYYSTDQSSYSPDENVQSTRVKIDYTEPQTTDNSDDRWHNEEQDVTLTCNDPENPDASGCSTIEYCVDHEGENSCNPSTTGESFSGNSGTLTVSEEGVNSLRYRSTDVAGNTEAIRSTEVKIDYTAPRAFIDKDQADDMIQSNVSCADELSGCDPGTEKMKIYEPETVPNTCPEDRNAYDKDQKTQLIAFNSYVCGSVIDRAGNTDYSQEPVEFTPDIYSTDFIYPSSTIIAPPGNDVALMHEVENLEGYGRSIEITLEGPSAEFLNGDSSLETTVGPESRLVKDVSISAVEGSNLTARIKDKPSGQVTEDRLEIGTTNKGSAREVPGISNIQIIFLLAISAYIYSIKSTM